MKQTKQTDRKWMRQIIPFLLAVILFSDSLAVSRPETLQAAVKNRIVLEHRYESLYVGESFTLKAKARYNQEGRRISCVKNGRINKDMTYPYFIFSSDNPGVASVSEKGVVKAKKKGSTTITMTHIYDSKLKAVIRLKVKEKPKKMKIQLKSSKATVVVGKAVTIGVKKVTGLSGKEVTFSSGNKKIATVNNRGIVVGKASGTAKITVTSALNKKAKATFCVNVITADMEGTSYSPKGQGKIVLAEEEVTLAPYNSFKTSGWWEVFRGKNTVSDWNAFYKEQQKRYGQSQIRVKSISGVRSKAVRYTSSDSTVAEVSSSGFVKPKRAGIALITVASKADPKVKATYKVIVRNLVTGIEETTYCKLRFEPDEYDKRVYEDGYRHVDWLSEGAEVLPENAENKNMIVTSDNEKVIRVEEYDGTWELILTGKGEANLTIKSEDGFFETTRNIVVADEDRYYTGSD